MIIPTAEPFFFPGQAGQPGCLLIHGFTGAPKEMRWMGEYLSKQGFHSLGVRLTGHATRPEDMIRSRYSDWMASVEDGYHILRGITARVYLAGLSMGGILSLLMSTKLNVAGVIAMSTPYRVPINYPSWALWVVSKFIRYQPKVKGDAGETWFDKDAYAEHISYPYNPIRSALELKYMLAEMRAALPLIEVPVLLVHSRSDQYVLPENLERIYRDLTTPNKTKLYVTEAGHVITRDRARDEVFTAAKDFILKVETST